ncbi:MAG: ribonuclease E inhibitor RraA/Dimethylmenaquinone methyltransferase [Monoraphidium minutum]|nr:MAG: ribonuclease E inhibitor RraA/Dimethylmenaquinone methyltransferase [Monoraphidium minutum]
MATADLCDKYHTHDVDVTVAAPAIQVLPPLFRDYGGRRSFAGPAHTIRCYENNPLVRKAVTGPGGGRVLVVDGGGSTRCALLGDMLADEARKKRLGGGIIVYGCIRDSEGIGAMPELGVKALATCPLKSSKRDPGVEGVAVIIGGCTISPGDWVYADGDGVVVAKQQLSLDN